MTALLQINDLSVRFATPEGEVRAVEKLNLQLEAGQTLAVVGESGSGKTQAFMAALGLLARNGQATGEVLFENANLLAMDRAALDEVRGDQISFIFQDPMTALNPSLTIARQLTEVLERHRGLSAREAREQSIDMLTRVGLPDAAHRIDTYSHRLSGGMRQRVMIAMALLCRPRILIADEPTTALDVTLQAQILELFIELKREYGSSVVLITHDLGVVATLAETVAVMYAGRIVEMGLVDDIFAAPRHPYTRALLQSTPRTDHPDAALKPIEGQPPNLQQLPPGCAFHPRCSEAFARCGMDVPSFLRDGHHGSACFRDGHEARETVAEEAP
jgi:oligopeptide transport system ATP-binding protein